jgi:DNA replication protein DnaC
MLDTLEARLSQAHAGEFGHLEFLEALCEDEISRRGTAALERRLRAARFEATTTMEEYDFAYNAKTPTALIRDLATLRFIEHGESVVLHGPVGVGKSHIAQALGHGACRAVTASSSPRRRACWLISPVDTPIERGKPGCVVGPDHRY